MNIKQILSIPCLLDDVQKLSLALSASQLSADNNIVEIGTYRGGSSCVISSCTKANMYTLDIFDLVDPEILGPDSKIKRHMGNSASFAAKYPDCKIDMLFIDGDHSLYGVRSDYLALREQLSPDAVVAFHDYTKDFPAVRIFCDALAHAGGISECIDLSGLLMCQSSCSSKLPTEESYDYAVESYLKFIESLPEQDSKPFTDKCEAVIKNIKTDWIQIGKGSFGDYFANFFGLDPSASIDSNEATANGKYMICSHFYSEIFNILTAEFNVKPENIIHGGELLSYAMYNDLCNNSGKKLTSIALSDDEKHIIKAFTKIPEDKLIYLACNSHLLEIFKRTSNFS